MKITILKAVLLCAELLPLLIRDGEKLKAELSGDNTTTDKVQDALNTLLDVVTETIKKLPEIEVAK